MLVHPSLAPNPLRIPDQLPHTSLASSEYGMCQLRRWTTNTRWVEVPWQFSASPWGHLIALTPVVPAVSPGIGLEDNIPVHGPGALRVVAQPGVARPLSLHQPHPDARVGGRAGKQGLARRAWRPCSSGRNRHRLVPSWIRFFAFDRLPCWGR